mgnify:CR=1 FL=1
MELKHELVREIMLYLEENLTFDKEIMSTQITIPEYTSEEIQYTVNKLYEAGFLKCKSFKAYKFKTILEITWNGHCFLDNIRDDNVWNHTKQKVSKLASISLPILSQVAASYIQMQLGISS